jgi:hypothetical protein
MNTYQCPEAIRFRTILGERRVYCRFTPRVKTGSHAFKWGGEKSWAASCSPSPLYPGEMPPPHPQPLSPEYRGEGSKTVAGWQGRHGEIGKLVASR